MSQRLTPSAVRSARALLGHTAFSTVPSSLLGESSIVLLGRELFKETALWAAEGHNRNHHIAIELEIARECLVSSRTRMPMAPYDLSIVVRYEAAFHFDIAIGAGVCFFHVVFLLLLFAGRCVGACFNR